MEPPGTASSTLNRKSRSSGRGRFSHRVNRSSSMHDLARARLEPATDQTDLSGVKWKDEQRLPNIGMPGIGTNGRTLSSKSLAVMPGENMMWNNGGLQGGLHGGVHGAVPGGVQGGVWPPGMNGMNFGLQPQQAFHPMMGSWAPVPGMMGQLGAMR